MTGALSALALVGGRGIGKTGGAGRADLKGGGGVRERERSVAIGVAGREGILIADRESSYIRERWRERWEEEDGSFLQEVIEKQSI